MLEVLMRSRSLWVLISTSSLLREERFRTVPTAWCESVVMNLRLHYSAGFISSSSYRLRESNIYNAHFSCNQGCAFGLDRGQVLSINEAIWPISRGVDLRIYCICSWSEPFLGLSALTDTVDIHLLPRSPMQYLRSTTTVAHSLVSPSPEAYTL